jgi:hypothetical protein
MPRRRLTNTWTLFVKTVRIISKGNKAMSSVEAPIGEREWQARYDASTLSDAEVIKANPARLQAAKDAAVKLAEEKGKEKKAMDKVARTPAKATPSPKGGQAPAKRKNSPTTGGTVGGTGSFNVFNKLPKG